MVSTIVLEDLNSRKELKFRSCACCHLVKYQRHLGEAMGYTTISMMQILHFFVLIKLTLIEPEIMI